MPTEEEMVATARQMEEKYYLPRFTWFDHSMWHPQGSGLTKPAEFLDEETIPWIQQFDGTLFTYTLLFFCYP